MEKIIGFYYEKVKMLKNLSLVFFGCVRKFIGFIRFDVVKNGL